MQWFLLWLAQGFGVGRIPFAPGTFGSMVGVLWVMVLLLTQNLWAYIAGTILGFFISVWLCGVGERILKQKDPSSVVMDEITAMPVCFLAFFAHDWFKDGHLPAPETPFASPQWKTLLIVFILFRVFDITKPSPVRQSQALHGGWGITVDDFLAGLYVMALTLIPIFWPVAQGWRF
ncbi:MAG TPA: phosphatidylglycerophosphatase A [Verrucomicrobiae bacterium]|jgi:phosphatidylglycerophosphatase A